MDHKEAVEKLRYMHRNLVKRFSRTMALSSYRHYALDEAGPVQLNVWLGKNLISQSGSVDDSASQSLLLPAAPFPPFATDAKDGAPTVCGGRGESKTAQPAQLFISPLTEHRSVSPTSAGVH